MIEMNRNQWLPGRYESNVNTYGRLLKMVCGNVKDIFLVVNGLKQKSKAVF